MFGRDRYTYLTLFSSEDIAFVGPLGWSIIGYWRLPGCFNWWPSIDFPLLGTLWMLLVTSYLLKRSQTSWLEMISIGSTSRSLVSPPLLDGLNPKMFYF